MVSEWSTETKEKLSKKECCDLLLAISKEHRQALGSRYKQEWVLESLFITTCLAILYKLEKIPQTAGYALILLIGFFILYLCLVSRTWRNSNKTNRLYAHNTEEYVLSLINDDCGRPKLLDEIRDRKLALDDSVGGTNSSLYSRAAKHVFGLQIAFNIILGGSTICILANRDISSFMDICEWMTL